MDATHNHYSDGPIWNAFGLTRASYAVFPRRALQSMPIEWQADFLRLVRQMHDNLPAGALDGDYEVTMRDERGRYATDPMREYRHTGPLPRKATQP